MGHTDDVADDAHNQKLAEDRAAAVKDRLAQLADLASWQVTATGKGGSEPAVKDATNQARAANRRVVITITPTSGTRNSAALTAAPSSAPPTAPSSSGAPDGTALPEPKGPVGAGSDGVTAVCTSSGSFVSDEQVTISLPQVVRAGGLLFGWLSVTVGPRGADENSVLSAWFDDSEFLLANARGEDGSLLSTMHAYRLTDIPVVSA
ncbi:OmpA family protein [Actinomyces israelii]|uniref:OmpA family protein n=1 Tax=Actinomyces israelii TaxID=1659 RepID=UPI002355B384|nr:OmpA family protein [Actinomyces israelii]